jgi:ketosteroid isomerase-like protein
MGSDGGAWSDREAVQRWLDAYVRAWETYDPDAVGALVTDHAQWWYDPWAEPVTGREAIVASWLEDRDPPGSWEAHYEPVAVEGDVAVATGYSRYLTEDRSAVDREYANVFLLRFAEDGRCREYREWYMRKGTG